MQRYFIEQLDINNNSCEIKTQDVHHIKNVMRNKVGDEIIVCDSNGVCFISRITDISNTVKCALKESVQSNDLPVNVDIAQALIRRERFEYMIQKSTELGVRNIIPVKMRNSIIKLDSKKQDKKIERWNILAKEASEQSHRNILSHVDNIHTLKEINYEHYDLVLVAYEKENSSTVLKSLLSNFYQNILIVIGPEGGFTEQEIQYLESIKNSHLVGLGKRILRSETASSYILSVLSYVYEMSE